MLDVFGNGRVKLYQRGKRGIYQAKITIPGATGHYVRTSGTTALNEAIAWAGRQYDELYLKVKQGGSLKSVPTVKGCLRGVGQVRAAPMLLISAEN